MGSESTLRDAECVKVRPRLACVCTALSALLVGGSASAASFRDSGDLDSDNAPQGIVSVYGGLEVAWWNIEWGDSSESVWGTYERETDPFVRYWLELKLAPSQLLDFGLGYLTDRFAKFGNFSESDDLADAEDPVSRTLYGFIHLMPPVEGLSFEAQLELRRFESRATALGNAGAPQSYVPSDGDPQILQPGQEATWFSSVRDFHVRGIYELVEETMDVFAGYRRVTLVTPTDTSISLAANDLAFFNTLMGLETTCSGLELGIMHMPSTRQEGLTWVYEFPVYIGSQSLDNDYLTADGGLCVGWGGKVGIRYQAENFAIDAGGAFVQLASSSEPGGTPGRSKQPIDAVDVLGNPATVPGDTDILVNTDRFENFPSLYFRAAYAF